MYQRPYLSHAHTWTIQQQAEGKQVRTNAIVETQFVRPPTICPALEPSLHSYEATPRHGNWYCLVRVWNHLHIQRGGEESFPGIHFKAYNVFSKAPSKIIQTFKVQLFIQLSPAIVRYTYTLTKKLGMKNKRTKKRMRLKRFKSKLSRNLNLIHVSQRLKEDRREHTWREWTPKDGYILILPSSHNHRAQVTKFIKN